MRFVPEIAALAGLLATLVIVPAADWPQYAGPNGDGSSPETIRTNWTEQAPREVWRKPMGSGFSSVAVVGGRIFTLERRISNGNGREFCVALDAETGNELWATDVDRADYTNLSNYDDRMDGPRSTPTVAGEFVYVFTSQLKLLCLRIDTGNLVWQRDFPTELGSNLIPWENAASPLLAGDLIFVNANAPGQHLMAVRISDGTTAWSGQGDIMTHSTPVFGTVAGVPQVIFLTASGLVGVAPDSGSVLWRLNFTPSSTSTAASPAVAGEYVFASANYGYGTWVARVATNGTRLTASQSSRQQGNAYQCHWSTPILHDGFLYCIPSPSSPQAKLTCFDVAAGTNRWAQTAVGSASIGFGSVIKAGNLLVVLTEAGELVLVQPNPTAYTELARFKVLSLYCWNRVTLSNGRLYARSTSLAPEMIALDVAPSVAPLPPVRLAAQRAPDDRSLMLTVRAADGSNLDANQSSRLEFIATKDLALPLNQWSVLNPVSSTTNGIWFTQLPIGSEPALYLRAREKADASGIPLQP